MAIRPAPTLVNIINETMNKLAKERRVDAALALERILLTESFKMGI